MDPVVFNQWLAEQQALINARVANNEEIEVPLHNLFWSDGRADKIPGPNARMTKQDDTTEYLETLSRKYSNVYEVNLKFTSLPLNYTVWKQNHPRSDVYLYGHPRGRFASVDQLIYHIWHLINNQISQCDCKVCEGRVRG